MPPWGLAVVTPSTVIVSSTTHIWVAVRNDKTSEICRECMITEVELQDHKSMINETHQNMPQHHRRRRAVV